MCEKKWALRLFAVSWGVVFGLLAYLLHSSVFVFTVWPVPLIGTAACAVGLLKPYLLRRPYLFAERIFAPVGGFFALLMLAIVYYGVFTPYALVLRMVCWDPLRLRKKRNQNSAWHELPSGAGATDYYWQY